MNKIIYTIIGLLALSSVVYAQTPGGINVYQGGTGYTSIPQYGWLSGGGTGALRLVSSTSPTVGYLTATSTTSASTFSILNVLTRLGIATTTGTDALNLVGDFQHNGSDVQTIENNKSQAGALMFDGFTTNARAYYTLNQDIGTASTTLFLRFKVSPNPGSNVGLLAFSSSNTAATAAYGFGTFIDSAGKLAVRIFGSTTANFKTIYLSQATIQAYANQIIDLVIVKRNLSTTDVPLIYINGILQTTSGSDTAGGSPPDWNGAITSTYALIGARLSTAIYNDRIYKVQVFNRALSESDILQIRERGIAHADQWGSLTGQTSGTLTRGKRYVITTYVAGDDFTNIGASANATGIEFTTTGTTPTTWTNGSTLNEVGAILDANLEFANPAASTVITDNSSNKYVGTVTATGVTQVKPTYQINNLFFDRTTGNVGIGTTSPVVELEVDGGANVDLLLRGTSASSLDFADTADTNVGQIYYDHTSDYMRFKVNDAEILRITSTGNVGIGTTSPYAKLSVTNTGSTPSFIVEDSTSPDVTPFIIDASGNVGMGTTSPQALLDVGGKFGLTSSAFNSLGTPVSMISSDLNSITGIEMRNINTGSAADFRFLISDTSNHYMAFFVPSINNTIAFFGAPRNTSDYLINNGGTSRNLTIGTYQSNDLIFGTSNTERMRITSAGNVGIGTTTPQWLLNPTSTTSPQLSLSAGAGVPQWTFRNAGGNLYLSTTTVAGTATSSSAAFAIDSNGYTTRQSNLYSEIFAYETSLGNASTTATTAGVYYPIRGWSTTTPSYAGGNSGPDYFTIDNYNGSTTVKVAGKYRLSFVGSFRANKAAEVHTELYKNGVALENCAAHAHVSLSTEGGEMTMNCKVKIDANEYIDSYVQSSENSTVFVWDSLNLNLEKISDI